MKKSRTEEAKTEVKDVEMITVNADVARDSQLSETTASTVSNGDWTATAENEIVEMKDVDTVVNTDVNVGQSSDAISDDDDDKTRKVAKEMQSNKKGAGSENVGGKRKLQIQGKWIGVDPVIFYNDETIMSRIKEFYGIQDSIPFSGHLVTRNSDTSHVKRIYYVSGPVKDVLELNLRAGQPLKIASVGLKMFVSHSYPFPLSFFSMVKKVNVILLYRSDKRQKKVDHLRVHSEYHRKDYRYCFLI